MIFVALSSDAIPREGGAGAAAAPLELGREVLALCCCCCSREFLLSCSSRNFRSRACRDGRYAAEKGQF